MAGHTVNYLYYPSGKSNVTIPRAIIEAAQINWEHGDEIKILIKTIDGSKGLFLYKKEGKDKKSNLQNK